MRRGAPAAAALAAALAAAAPAGAALYSYTDERGVVHYSNVPSDPRYRVVPGSDPPEPARPAAPGAGGSPGSFADEIERSCADHGVDSALVRAVIKAESNFNPGAVSRAGAQGLMQLMPETARLRNVGDPFDPAANIDGGVRHLRELLDTFGDTRLALAAYNAGEGAVRRHGGVPPFPETRSYVETVLGHYARYLGTPPPAAAPGAGAPEPRPRIVSFVNAEGVRVFTNTPWKYADPQAWRRERSP